MKGLLLMIFGVLVVIVMILWWIGDLIKDFKDLVRRRLPG